MPVTSDAPAQLYTIAWVALLAIFIFYVVVGVALRWRVQHTVRVTRYDPPQGISPSVAAFLIESGRCERSFAAALISLATKGYLAILQKADWLTLDKLRDADVQLPPEESAILSFLFPSVINTYSFNGSDTSRLYETYTHFRETVHNIVTPELMSTHGVLWLVGLIYSLTVLEPIVFAMPGFGNGLSLASIGFLIIVIFVGGSCFIAALRVWPGTLRKLTSFVPGSRYPRRPFNLNDAIPLFLTVTALFGFMFVAVLTSTKLAGLAAAALAMNVFSRHLLNAPTSAGRKALAELRAFREFLARTDAVRLDYQNEPGKTPRKLDPSIPYAVALGVEHGWGEDFAGNLLELLQADQAYSASGKLPASDNRSTVLKLFDRDR
jgi:Predicted membrane protein (DUF2207) C-terminal domain